jgi:hypothetical protein
MPFRHSSRLYVAAVRVSAFVKALIDCQVAEARDALYGLVKRNSLALLRARVRTESALSPLPRYSGGEGPGVRGDIESARRNWTGNSGLFE